MKRCSILFYVKTLIIKAMKRRSFTKCILTSILISLGIGNFNEIAAQATWVHLDANHTLVYKTDAHGNKVMDFSTSGYMGGGVALPNVPVKVILGAKAGDQTEAIQAAINQVSAMPLVNGVRGTVLLSPGTYVVTKTISIQASGVVLRGSGSGTNGTVLSMTNANGFLCLNMAGSGDYVTSGTVNLTDAYIPSGATSFNVSNASGFKVGGSVLIYKPVTQKWVSLLGMDKLVRNGASQTWIPVGAKFKTDRIIKAINENTITLDAPLTDNFDAAYVGSPVGTISNYSFNGRISQCGVENLQILGNNAALGNRYKAISMNDIMDSWVSDVVAKKNEDCFSIGLTGKRITYEKVLIDYPNAPKAPAPSANFNITGTQILLSNCSVNSPNTHQATTSAMGTGPIVFLNFKSESGSASPHQRWTTGILMDNCKLKGDHGINFINRTILGSGHGWTTAWSVVWNCESPGILMTQAPGTMSWVIGSKGTKQSQSGQPDGIFDHFNTHVTPCSIYLQQLSERLGTKALANIGYLPSSVPVSYCQNSTATALIATGSALKWYTSPTGGTGSTTAPIPLTTAIGTVNYYVSQTINGCESERAPLAVTIRAAASATITANGPVRFCTGGSVTLTASTGSSYVWRNGTTQVGTAATYTAANPGSYTVQVTNANGCKATSAPAVVSVNTGSTWYADLDGDGTGDATVTKQSCVAPPGYVATSGDACPADKNKLSPGVCGCGRTENSCGNTAPVVAFTKPLNSTRFDSPATLLVNVTATDTDGISNVKLYLNGIFVRQENVAPYDWNHTGLDALLQNMAAGTYSLKAVATDSKGLSGETSITILVKSIVANPDVIIGSTCGLPLQEYTYEINPANKVNATVYSWWFTGSAASVVRSGDGTSAKVKLSPSFSSGEVCVGVNLSVAPYYVQHCKAVSSCTAPTTPATMAAPVPEVMIYPNPAATNFTVQASIINALPTRIEVSNSYGEIVLETSMAGLQTIISVDGLKEGIYSVKTYFVNDISTQRLLIIK